MRKMNEDYAAIEALQNHYILALDEKNWDGWLQSFAPDGQYFAVAADDAAAGRPLALMMDDCYERLQDRVSYITRVWTYEEYQTRHFAQRLKTTPAGDNEYDVVSNFSIFFTSEAGETNILVTGKYEDRIVVSADGARFKKKRAVIDSFLLPRYLVYPL
jgi:3-phenylpropionate/cinnamic acid dioxygenase small subunit